MHKKTHRALRPIPSPQSLANAALAYLGRFAASEQSLRQVLHNRIRRAAQQHPDFAANHEAQQNLRVVIEQIIARHKQSGVINDAALAAMKVRSLRRAGRSTKQITEKLQNKGIAKQLVSEALQPEEGEADSAALDLQAAQRLVKKRKLGALRGGAFSAEQNRKDFAILARAGFSYAIAKQALAAVLDEDAGEW